MQPSKRTIAALLAGLLIITQSVALAQDPALTNIIVTNTRDDLLIYLTVTGAFSEKMEKALQSGVPATFSYFIDLYRTRSLWLDKKVTETRLTHTIQYDNLKKEYIVTRSWEGDKPHVVKKLGVAKKLMSEVDSLAIVALKHLQKGEHYQIRAKAELSKLTLPFYLHYVLFFVSLWDFETDWYTIDFIY